MNIFHRLYRLVSRRISGASIGIIMHEAEPQDLDRLATLGRPSRVPLIRTTNDGTPESAQRVLALSAVGYPLLVTVPFGKGFGPVGPGMVLQIDDEPDRQSPAVSPEHYGETFRSTMHAMRQTLPSSIPIVTAGFSPYASAEWIRRALCAGAIDADAVCFHLEGYDLREAFAVGLEAVTKAMSTSGAWKPLWITNVAPTAWDHAARAIAIQALLAMPELRAVERIYIGPLSAPHGYGDLLGICDHDRSRTPRPAFAVVQKAMGRL